MADEVIDLTRSPPPPSRSESPKALNLTASTSISAKKTQFKRTAQWVPRNPAFTETHELSHVTFKLQASMNGDKALAEYKPVAESNAFSFPHGTNLLKDRWTAKEHELFLTGINKYGKRCWSEISKSFEWNKTPEQVQSYATDFFRNPATTYQYSFMEKFQTSNAPIFANLNKCGNVMGEAATNPDFKPVSTEKPPPTLLLFPEEASSSTVSPAAREVDDDFTLQMPVPEAEFDLELSLG